MFRRLNPWPDKFTIWPFPKAFPVRLNLEEMIEPMARAVELTISVEARPGVAASLLRLAEAADAVMAFPLSDDVEIAQVFVP
jgi:hypothetical protein